MRQITPKMPNLAIALSVLIALLPVGPAFAVATATGAVHGAVTAADTGAPLPGVTFKVLDLKTAETIAEFVTTEEGKVELSEIPFGLYQVSVVAPEGYAGAAGPLVYLDEDNAAAAVSFTLEPLPSAPAGGGAMAGRTLLLIGLLVGGAVGVAAIVHSVGQSVSE